MNAIQIKKIVPALITFLCQIANKFLRRALCPIALEILIF